MPERRRGEILLFLDSDCMASPEWLKELHKAYTDPTVMGVTGRVIKVVLEEALNEIPTNLLEILRRKRDFDPGEEQRVLPHHVKPVGACLSVRKSVFHKVGGFRTDLGLKGDFQGDGEETEWCQRFLRQGLAFTYVPGVRVEHVDTADRFNVAFRRRSAFHGGQTKVVRKYGTQLPMPRRVWLFVVFSLELIWIALRLLVRLPHFPSRFRLSEKLMEKLGRLYALLSL